MSSITEITTEATQEIAQEKKQKKSIKLNKELIDSLTKTYEAELEISKITIQAKITKLDDYKHNGKSIKSLSVITLAQDKNGSIVETYYNINGADELINAYKKAGKVFPEKNDIVEITGFVYGKPDKTDPEKIYMTMGNIRAFKLVEKGDNKLDIG